MKITILGSGSFFIDKDHSAPGYLIETGDKNILFDCGPGTLNQLAKIDFDPLKIDYIFLTHFHNDHTSDLIALMFRPYIFETFYGGKFDKVLKIVGPKGTEKFVRSLSGIFQHNELPNFSKLEYIEYEPEMQFEGFKIETFHVDHSGLDASALRLSAEGKVLAYTGDASLSEGVIEVAKNADLLIADTSNPKWRNPAAHMSTTQVGEICRDNGVKKVILSHQIPPGYNVDMVSEVKEVFDGDVVLAKDLMQIEL
jgi:ribonuclease BN (tRNA processing enzyme)